MEVVASLVMRVLEERRFMGQLGAVVSYAVAEKYRKCNRISDRCGQATSALKGG